MKNVVITVLAILVLGLGGYLVYDKVIDKDVNEEVKEENGKQESKDFDLVEAKKLIDKYISQTWFREESLEGALTESKKIVMAINSTKSKEIDYTYKEAFPDGKLENEQFLVEINNSISATCYESKDDKEIAYTYDDVNKTYKELFGEEQDLPKTKISEYTYRYAYSEKYDAYLSLSCECGVAYPTTTYYDIIQAIEVGDNLEVYLNYVKFEYDESSNNYYIRKRYDIGVTAEDIFDVTDEQRKQLYNRAIKEDLYETQKYKFTFKKNDSGYYLESIVNEVY